MRITTLFLLLFTCLARADAPTAGVPYDGYKGIWYFNQETNDEYVYKYSGGLATYTADHIPMAIYAPSVEKTFFVYGGTVPEKNSLAIMVSYYDHRQRLLPRPTFLVDRKTSDAHDNPALAIDKEGYLWVFLSSHGQGRPSYIVKSREPYSIAAFDTILETNFSYPQPWYHPAHGFLFLHTWYQGGRGLHIQQSADGVEWGERTLLSHMEAGHYQVSWPLGERMGTAFNYHPKQGGLNFRTNLYYVESPDWGKTWNTVNGQQLSLPLTDKHSPALVHHYEPEGLKVYIMDINYDQEGRPVILHVVSKGWEPGPRNGPHLMRVAHWTGTAWALHEVAPCDNNYDMGSLYTQGDGMWRILVPSDPGPQAFNPGGEMVLWRSSDQGGHWERERQVTQHSTFNHTYARRPLSAHPGFMAFWADGDTRKKSESRLYFWDDEQQRVYRMPQKMEGDTAQAEPLE